jgi:hypothetical protein
VNVQNRSASVNRNYNANVNRNVNVNQNVNVNRNVNVNVHGGCYNCGYYHDNSWNWGSFAVGGAVGVATTAVVAAATHPSSSTIVVVQAPAVGAVVPALPWGCATISSGGAMIYNCGNVYYRPCYQGTQLVYQVVTTKDVGLMVLEIPPADEGSITGTVMDVWQCALEDEGREFSVSYQPAESETGLFGGNSNWRGPVWFPMNVLILRGFLHFYLYYGDDFKVECPTGSGKMLTLYEVATELSRRLYSTFLKIPRITDAVPCTAPKENSNPTRIGATSSFSTNTSMATTVPVLEPAIKPAGQAW